uniref:FIG000605: protein co-occurring with transport systems (COG1739) n=1 Tax=uncultured Thiotrichaceae bacterium TaxID=298394 RepID=A0A6S6SDX0_9GAMM|nr:MAG: FIG000605: protein co-occurring with transport systems (COG1739) [uncultured Thiotrichaceae bacterium]
MSNYLIPEKSTQFEQLIKKSRFIAFVGHAPDPESAYLYIESIRSNYPDARHVCWAFLAGEPNNTTNVSCSDDGEPAGTAGKPMLNVLQHSDVGEIVAVVVRYFGGIKLGTGGLARAYSGSVTEALKMMPTCMQIDYVTINLNLAYALEDSVRHLLSQFSVEMIDASYAETLRVDCQCPKNQWPVLRQRLADVGRGRIVVNEPE